MKTSIVPSSALGDFLLHALAYLLWLVNTLVCAVAVIQLRSSINMLWVALGGDRYSLSLVNQVCLLLGGFAALVYVVILEGYYRESITGRVKKPVSINNVSAQALGLRKSDLRWWLADLGVEILLRRFAITTAIPLGVFVLSLAMIEIALRVLTWLPV